MEGSERLLQTIKEQNIRPTPGWQFRIRNLLVWSGFSISVLFGALAFSVILFAIQQADFQALKHISHSWLELFLGLLPFFWLIALIVFLLIAMISILHSKTGYKLTLAKLAGISALLSILFGTIFFIGGGGQKLENSFSLNVSLYESIQEKKIKLWSRPQNGYLSGQIQDVQDSTIKLLDFNNKTWIVRYENSFIPPSVMLEQEERIKLSGKMVNSDTFTAEEIRPWGGFGGKNGQVNRGLHNRTRTK
jgi:hypothetical protein